MDTGVFYRGSIFVGAIGLVLISLQPCTLLGNPEGGAVVGGQAAISHSGTTLQVLQSSDRAVINWRDFSIQPNETTRFIQPSASSAVLNRVTSSSPSQLLGALQANGQVYLMNQNGIFVGQGAVINASSFLATTAEANPSSFMRGEALSMVAASDAGIRNEGTIHADGGSIHLLSKHVENLGKLEAPEGTVGLYAGNRFYLEQDTGGPIRVRIDMDSSTSGSRAGVGVDQQGIIRAARVNLEANGNIYALAIQQSGLVEATGFVTRQDGTVVLSAPGGKILQSGTMLAKNSDESGGQMELRGADVELDLGSILTASGSGVGSGGGAIKIDSEGTSLVRGQLDVSSISGQGGRLVVTGQRVGFLEGKMIASGGSGGGEVLLGGDYQGKNAEVKNAQATVMGKDAEIVADAMVNGDGGKIILWSDEYTGFYGQLFARGGPEGGNGGFIETSSKNNLQAYGFANASAISGSAGKWLLDPRNVSIQTFGTGTLTGGVFTPSTDNATIAPVTITSALDLGTSVEINTGTTGGQVGDITVANAVATSAGAADASLTLKAANSIIVNAAIDLSTMVGAGNISLLADADASGSGTVTLNAAVTSGTTGTVTLQGASRIQVGTTLTARNVIFRQSTTGTTMGVADSIGTVQVTLSDLQNLSANGTVTLGRSDSTGTIRIGGTAALDLSGESYGLDVLTASGGQTRLNGNITTAGKAITFDSAVIITGDRSLKTDQRVATGAAITMNKAVDSDGLSGATGAFWDLSLVAGTGGDVTFAQAVGVGARLGNITVGPANNLSIQGALRAESLATASLVTLGGNVNLNGSLDFSNHGIASTTVGLNLVAAGKITLNAGADVTTGGAVTLQGAGGIETGADFLAVDSSVTFRSPVTLTGPVALTVQGATAGGGLAPEIRFESTVESALPALSPNLTLDGGSFGNVVFVGGAGQINPLGTVQVVSANNLTVAAMRANSFQQSAGYGQTTFNGPQNYSAANSSNLGLGVTTVGNIAVAAASITTGNGGTVTLNAGQRIDIGSGGDISSGGAVTFTAGSGITTGGDILTSGDDVQFKSAVLLASDLTVDTTTSGSTLGKVIFSSTLDGPYGLTVKSSKTLKDSAGAANVQFLGNVGSLNSLADLDVAGFKISLQGSKYTIDQASGGSHTATFDGSVILGADAVFDLSGVTADNSLSFLGTLNSDGTARSMQITTGSGQLRFDGSVGSDAALKDFFVTSAGSWASTGVINLTAGTVTINAIQVANPAVGVSIQANGLVTIGGNIGTSGTPLASLSIQGSSIGFGGTEIRTTGQLNLGSSIYTTPDVEGPGGNLALLATTGDITATGLIDTRGRTGVSQQNGGNVTITTAGNISVADINTSAGTGKDAGLISIDSGNSKTITLKGTLTATGGRNGSAVIFNDDISLGAATSILTGGTTGTSGDITFAETLGGAQSLALNSGSADITFSGAATMTGAGTIGMTADTINLNAALSSVSGAIGMTADTINLSAALSSVSGDITLKPFTSGLGMSISDSSAVGLVLTKAETAQIATSGRVTFGGTSTGTIELAGTAATTFGYNVSFQTSEVINLNGNLNAGSNTVTLGSNLALTTPATLTAGIIQISGLSITGGDFTLNAPEVDVTATVGTDVTISSNLLFPQNTSLSGVGRNMNFAGTLNSSGGQRNLVITAGKGGDITFVKGVGAVVSFGNILVQGQDVGLGAGASIRGRSVTVDAVSFLNRAGGSALISTTGRTLVFSANPNDNYPTTFNGGISGLVPVFNQAPQIQITGAGAFTVGNSLPGGSLALYQDQLADVLPLADLFQITDQQAYLAAVPITGITLPRLYLGEVVVNRAHDGSVSEFKNKSSQKHASDSGLGIKGKEGKPVTRLPKSLETRREDVPIQRGVTQKIGSGKGGLSYSQYSQSFDSLSQ
jgi:filamentous hemagglutinin family protein